MAPGSTMSELSTSILQLATRTPAPQCAGTLMTHSAGGMTSVALGPEPPPPIDPALPEAVLPPLPPASGLPPKEVPPTEPSIAPAAPPPASDSARWLQPRTTAAVASNASCGQRTGDLSMRAPGLLEVTRWLLRNATGLHHLPD